ncbi:TIR domain-containing protein [Brevundimonas sp.]|uniref:TIR domain-containing protein n=1 Tax=Brevundimonas sp. TaxID=1871086 RepID=UPI003D6C7CBE
MPYLHRYKLFISHAWRYSEGYQRMVNFLDAAPNFIHSNYSIPTDRAFSGLSRAGLEEQLRCQIRPVDTVIIMAGMYAAHSDWIKFEIDYAKYLNKPILGVVPWGGERTPLVVQNAATEMVAWNTNSIVSAIRRITP